VKRIRLSHSPHPNNIDVINKRKGYKSNGNGTYYRVVRNSLGGNRFSAWKRDPNNHSKYRLVDPGSGLFIRV
jgi:hypothetical protein